MLKAYLYCLLHVLLPPSAALAKHPAQPKCQGHNPGHSWWKDPGALG
jgi:hypothetical protein